MNEKHLTFYFNSITVAVHRRVISNFLIILFKDDENFSLKFRLQNTSTRGISISRNYTCDD